MRLVQKLPLGLALAACMMMSSCSQEDVAEPEKEKIGNSFSSAHGIPYIIPYIPTTNGPAGDNQFAPGWSKDIIYSGPDELVKYATGTSTVTHLWGNPSAPWVTPLLAPLPNADKIITTMYQKNVLGPGGTHSQVKTTIKNLKAGHKYAVTIFGASTIRVIHGQSTQYAKAIGVEISNAVPVNPASTIAMIDLDGKECEWVSKTITFEAKGSEAVLRAYCTSTAAYNDSQQSFYHYGHIYVGPDAVKEIFQ